MNSPIAQAFKKAAQEERSAFIPFVCGGYPSSGDCLETIMGLDQAGADLIEVGIPFSDPQADGPVIQEAARLALESGVTPQGVLDLAARAAPLIKAPLVLMTYYNPLLNMGLQKFAQGAARAGAAGVIVSDLPPEEAGPWLEQARAQALDTIFLAAPTTPDSRLAFIAEHCQGFLYYVSLKGVTGSALDDQAGVVKALGRVKQAVSLPVAVGFGVSRPDQARALGEAADGVIVGSALVACELEADSAPQGRQKALALAREIREGLSEKAMPEDKLGA